MNLIVKKCFLFHKKTLIGLSFLLFLSCQDWNQWDDPAGNQKNLPPPDYTPRILAEYTFEENVEGQPILYENGTQPEIVADAQRNSNVMHLKNAYLKFDSPLKGATLANGASITFWMKMTEEDRHGALFSFGDENGNILYYNGNSGLYYKNGDDYLWVNNPDNAIADDLAPGQWSFVAILLGKSGFSIYIDGVKKYDLENNLNLQSAPSPFEYNKIVAFLQTSPYFYLGHGGTVYTKEAYYDDVRLYTNTISEKDAKPELPGVTMPDPVYFNSFEESHTATIVGNGSFVASESPAFGTVFQNAKGGTRQNYLLLPEDVLSHSSATKELSICFWVNASNAGASSEYMWSPLFSAYGAAPVNGENTWPMFILQYRGIAQVNCAGWCDFTDAQNVKGVNTMYHDSSDWLADHNWHFYTATLTETTAKIYFDGELKNEWVVDGNSEGAMIRGLFSNGADLKYICLGGNQAWNWGDQDPAFMFDDIAIYNVELTTKDIATIMSQK